MTWHMVAHGSVNGIKDYTEYLKVVCAHPHSSAHGEAPLPQLSHYLPACAPRRSSHKHLHPAVVSVLKHTNAMHVLLLWGSAAQAA